jgi:hypothetical protein
MPIKFILCPPDLDLNYKFHIKPFKYTKIRLTRPERSLLRKQATRLQAFAERIASSSGARYQHCMKVCDRNEEPKT